MLNRLDTSCLGGKRLRIAGLTVLALASVSLAIWQIARLGGQDGMSYKTVHLTCPNGHVFSLSSDEVKELVAGDEQATRGSSLTVPCQECSARAQRALKCPDCGMVFRGYVCPECSWSKNKELRRRLGRD